MSSPHDPNGTDESSGTGWAENETGTPTSLSERLARLAPPTEDDLGDDFTDDFAEDEYDDFLPYDDSLVDREALARELGLPQPGHANATDAAIYTAVSAESAPRPTSVPGLTGAASAGSGRRSRRARRRRLGLPAVALLLMTALMAAATSYLWLLVREKDQTESARRAGLEVTRDAARLLFSYDYRTLDKDFSTGRQLTTGQFRKDYDKTTTKVVTDVAKQYKAVVKATVVNAGVVRAAPDEVVTVVYVNQVTTSTRVTGEKLDLSRVRMTLVRIDGSWRVSQVDAL